jgi:hypothetical protein
LWLQLYTVGLLNEGRTSARRLEWLRLLVVVPVLYFFWQWGVAELQQAAAGWLVLVLYLVLSAVGLLRISGTKEKLITH